MPEKTPAREIAFGDAVVKRKFATREQVGDCLAYRVRCADELGEAPALSRIMIQRKVITRAQAEAAIEDVVRNAAERGGAVADEEGLPAAKPSAPAPLPADAQPAAASPAAQPQAAGTSGSGRSLKVSRESASRLKSAEAPKEIAVSAAPSAPAAAAADEDIPPDGIKGYRILGKVGRGSMGSVYKAHQVSMDRLVALKVLPKAMTENEPFVNRFLSEARSAGKLNHPNVIRVHEVGKAGGIYYYSMEYVAGQSLDKIIRRMGRIEPKRCHRIMLQVAQALDHGHRNGLIHREVRPEAVMVDAEDQTKLADLGITKVGSTKFLLGTNAQYVAPEQIQGGEVDSRTDIYAFGCTFYHALGGRAPFRANTPKDILASQLAETPMPLGELAPDLPADLAAVVDRCLSKSPEGRYQAPMDLVAALQAVDFEPQKPSKKISGRRTSRRRGAGRSRRRRRR